MRKVCKCSECQNYLGPANRESNHWLGFKPTCKENVYFTYYTKKHGICKDNCKFFG